MRILIFGSGGALAGQLEVVFADQDVVALSHADCDITNAEAVSAAVKKYHPSHILNAAAYNAVDEAEVDDSTAVAVNTTAVGHIARAAAEHGAVMVYYSTDYVFDGMKREGYSETDPTNPVNAYGRSKLGGERGIETVAASNPNFQYFIIRTSRLFGPQGFGASAKKSFVDLLLEQQRLPGPIEVIDAEVSSPTYTVDLALATRRLLESGAASGIYHLTNSGTCTRYECAREIFQQWSELTSTPVPTLKPIASFPNRKAARPAYSVLLNTKLPPLRPWQEALREYLTRKSQCQNPNAKSSSKF